jgi:GxxExxY protein
MTENELATIVLDICFKIHREYGPGLYESVYEDIFCFELDKTELNYTRQQAIPLIHEGKRLESGFRADIIVENKLIVEIKSVEALAPVHSKQVLTYLKLSKLKLGLLINFNVDLLKHGIRRLIN